MSGNAVQEAPVPPGHLGARQRKHDGDQYLAGRADYVNDVMLPGTVHVALVRSPHPHARIVGIDTSEAQADPSVVAVLTGEQAATLAGPIPHYMSPSGLGGKHADVHCLAQDKVVYAGQPVVAVVAQTRADAAAAADLIQVRYDPLPFLLDADHALRPDAPRLYEDWPDNVLMAGRFADGDFDAAARDADHTVADEVRMQRSTTAPMETRGYIADWDDRTQKLTFHGSCQNPHPLRWMLANTLGLEERQIRVVVPHVGGAFGLKSHGYPEEALVCVLSRLLDRPVKWIEDRSECMLVGGREQRHRFEIAFDYDGTIRGFRNHIVANLGAVTAAPGWGMVFLSAVSFPTGYAIENCDVSYQAVVTNKSPWNASRGFGKEAANLVMERAVELVADRTGLDPVEVRRRNLIPADQLPRATSGGLNIDSGDFHGLIDKALDRFDYGLWRRRQDEARREGRHLGIGVAFELAPEGADIPGALVGGFDTTTVRMDPSGKVTVLTGVTSPGSGNDTGIAQIVAAELGVPLSDITMVQGDTELCPYGFGNFSSRSTILGGSAAALAARDIAQKVRQVAGVMLGLDPADLQIVDGMVTDGHGAVIPVSAVAFAVYSLAFAVAAGIEPTLESTRTYKADNIRHTPDAGGRIQPYPTYASAFHVSLTEVDPETGVVTLLRHVVAHDCGTMINPMMVEGQVHGAVQMGIGIALCEELVYDPDGTPAVDGFKSYLMPRAVDMPSIELIHQVTPSPFTLLGTKGAGETGVGGALAAVTNAVADALRPFGVHVRELPLSPTRLLPAIAEGPVAPMRAEVAG
ncbi:xanthine dehydrogenase family protein molybdopterin-binding subunit [Pseudonocardia sp.]|uniref:xanthine dehydrogenase family protein molybdopterin-binding subunit n=1 Tax=Pseudonocardia sp. TaxID=60912 RepID=UPI0026232548|nr:xanthine dehydrogenase family protein molybdopterin-binding subunit [Pseudonocardia sp.]